MLILRPWKLSASPWYAPEVLEIAFKANQRYSSSPEASAMAFTRPDTSSLSGSIASQSCIVSSRVSPGVPSGRYSGVNLCSYVNAAPQLTQWGLSTSLGVPQ